MVYQKDQRNTQYQNYAINLPTSFVVPSPMLQGRHIPCDRHNPRIALIHSASRAISRYVILTIEKLGSTS